MSKSWILLLTFFCSTLLAFLLWRSPPIEFPTLLDSEQSQIHYPSAIVSNALTKQYNENGNLSYSLYSKRVNYYKNKLKNEPDIIFEKPNLIVYSHNEKGHNQNTKTHLTMTANTAKGDGNQDQLTLIGDVILKQKAINGNIIQLKTEELQVQLNERYARTTKPVIIDDQTGTISATGLNVFFDEKRIELLSKVKGQYVPQ